MASPDDNNRWMYLMDDNLLQDGDHNPSNAFFWYEQPASNNPTHSLENDSSRGDSDDVEKQTSRKRLKDEISNGAPTKACREKIRRDKLNDRFMELSAVLDPGKNPKTDKASVLLDALKVVTQLRSEVEQLKDSNIQLKEAVKELKYAGNTLNLQSEKSELRDEKLKLKLEKESLEQQIKLMISPSSYIQHPATVITATASQNQASHMKVASVSGLPAAGTMWQYMSAGSIDTSQDHVLRPPVA